MGRDDLLQIKPEWLTIVSIHTPVWGVTFSWQLDFSILHVSIHTPVWGVTNSDERMRFYFDVSIHTPVWGVTALPCAIFR